MRKWWWSINFNSKFHTYYTYTLHVCECIKHAPNIFFVSNWTWRILNMSIHFVYRTMIPNWSNCRWHINICNWWLYYTGYVGQHHRWIQQHQSCVVTGENCVPSWIEDDLTSALLWPIIHLSRAIVNKTVNYEHKSMRLMTTHLLKTGVLRNWHGETETAPFISTASHDSRSNSSVTFVIFLFCIFLNYVQHSTNIRDTFLPYFKRHKSKKKYRASVSWTTTSK